MTEIALASNEIVSKASVIVPANELKIELSRAKKELSALIEAHKDIALDASNPTSHAKIKFAWKQYNEPRIALEKKIKATAKDLRDQVRAFESEGNEIVAAWQEQENRFHAIWKAEDERKKAEKEAKALAEKKRVEDILKAIDEIRQFPVNHIMSNSGTLQEVIKGLREREFKEEDYQEFYSEAVEVLNSSIDKLEGILKARIEAEAVAEEQRKQQEELDRKRKEEEARIAADRAKFEEDQKAAREKQEAEEAERQAKIKAQQDEIDRQNRELEANRLEEERKERELKDAEEAAKKEAELKAKKEAEEKERLERLAEEDKAKELNEQFLRLMSVEDAFTAIFTRTNDHAIMDICTAQIAKLKD